MNVSKNLLILKKKELNTFTKKSFVNIKFYSDSVKCKNKNLSDCCDNDKINKIIEQNTICISNNKISQEFIHFENTQDSKLKCKNPTISVALIGGGYASICTTILLKQNPAIKEIRIIDTDNSLSGFVCDARQIDTSTIIKYFKRNSIIEGLRNSDIVAIMDETNFSMGDKGPYSQFILSSNYVKNVTECVINACPKSLIAVFAHPVTATLPLVAEMYKQSGYWDPNKIIGSTALESMRISAMTAALLDLNASFLSVPIGGGVDSLTVVPLLSRTKPFNNFSVEDQCMLTYQLRSADKKLHDNETKGPTLSNGVATAKFISILINGLKEQAISRASAYVRSDVLHSCQYMTSELQFGPNGVQQNFGLPKVSSKEISLIEQAIPVINKIINTVINFINTGKIQ